jgi:translation initiation factor 1
MPREADNHIVYSSERGRMCPRCELPVAECSCRVSARATDAAAGGDAVVRVRRETKGRHGKTVTTVSGIPLPPAELKALARDLKRRCGTGGSLKQGVLEIQGDHCQLLIQELRELGYTVKRAGG